MDIQNVKEQIQLLNSKSEMTDDDAKELQILEAELTKLEAKNDNAAGKKGNNEQQLLVNKNPVVDTTVDSLEKPVVVGKKVDSPSDIVRLNIEFTEPSTYKIVNEGGHTVTRTDNKSCFVYDQNPQTEVKKEETMTNRIYGLFSKKGGKLKTKKRRITKKRVQKLRPFKSRSKK